MVNQQLNSLFTLPLLPTANEKPIDLGNGRLSASVGTDGLIKSINAPHPEHGFVSLTSIEQFSNDKWYDTEYVRQYRRRLLTPDTRIGFGFHPIVSAHRGELELVAGQLPQVRWSQDSCELTSTFLVGECNGVPYLINQFTVYNSSTTAVQCSLAFGGCFTLNRCSYGQLTEGGPIPMPALENRLLANGNEIVLQNPHLKAVAYIQLFDRGSPLVIPGLNLRHPQVISYQQEWRVHVPPSEQRVLHAVYSLTSIDQDPGAVLQTPVADLMQFAFEHLRVYTRPSSFEHTVVQRNLDYIVSCCTVPVPDDEVCVITDHQLLPLSWNRDAYYMINFLVQSLSHGDLWFDASDRDRWMLDVRQIVRGHLRWMFNTADRPDGYWGRAYLTNGYCKDRAFQLDQQCYPIIELCDYHKHFGDTQTVRLLEKQIAATIETLFTHKHVDKWLFATSETPGDDEVAYPYHFSSQVLVWYMLSRLAELCEDIPILNSSDLLDWAHRVKSDCVSSFVTTLHDNPVFGYLTDLKGNYRLYHDANDLPTVCAPLWGFCASTDETWISTMRFAFSPDNREGYYGGMFSGLGSVHTPDPWPLGYAQELLFRKLTGDEQSMNHVMARLKRVVQWDGLLSEAVDRQTGEVTSRHWFSWPGAFLSTVLLYVRQDNFLEEAVD